jgi:queuine tRNA-ribosyltransferase
MGQFLGIGEPEDLFMGVENGVDLFDCDEECGCDVCKNYSRAYLCHLYRAHEMLGGTLGSMHNLYFIINLVKSMRQAILDSNFQEFKTEFLKDYEKGVV